MANFIDLLNALTNRNAGPGPNLLTGVVAPPAPMIPPTVAPLSLPPDVIPPAPVDRNAIMRRFAPEPEPTAPPQPADPGFLGKLALALQGVGAGLQGQGPQFL